MPDLNKIKLFEQKVQSLAGEPEYLADKGESLSSVTDEQQGVDSELSELLGTDVGSTDNDAFSFDGLDDLTAPDDFFNSLDNPEESEDDESDFSAGEIDLDSIGGDIDLDSIGGDIDLDSIGGDEADFSTLTDESSIEASSEIEQDEAVDVSEVLDESSVVSDIPETSGDEDLDFSSLFGDDEAAPETAETSIQDIESEEFEEPISSVEDESLVEEESSMEDLLQVDNLESESEVDVDNSVDESLTEFDDVSALMDGLLSDSEENFAEAGYSDEGEIEVEGSSSVSVDSAASEVDSVESEESTADLSFDDLFAEESSASESNMEDSGFGDDTGEDSGEVFADLDSSFMSEDNIDDFGADFAADETGVESEGEAPAAEDDFGTIDFSEDSESGFGEINDSEDFSEAAEVTTEDTDIFADAFGTEDVSASDMNEEDTFGSDLLNGGLDDSDSFADDMFGGGDTDFGGFGADSETESFGGGDDIFSLDGFEAPEEEVSGESEVADFSVPGEKAEEDDLVSLDEDTDDLLSLDVDGFDSFFDSGEFHNEEEEPAVANAGISASKESKKASDFEYVITAEELERIKNTLVHLPRNLKIAVEAFIGEGGYPEEEIVEVTSLLIKGAAPKKIAEVVSEKSGEKIELPAKFLTMRGVDFITETTSPWYVFKKKVLPIVLKASAAAGVLTLSFYLLFALIIPFFKVMDLYKEGYAALERREFHSSRRTFDKAFDIKPQKKWILKYAEKYEYHRQYFLAKEMYDIYLDYKWDKSAVLNYAELLSDVFEDYEEAEKIINQFRTYGNPDKPEVAEYFTDKDLCLAGFWNCMKWAESDPEKYRDAGFYINLLVPKYDPELQQIRFYYAYKTGDEENFEILKPKVINGIYVDPKKKKHIHMPIAIEMCQYLYDEQEYNQFILLVNKLRTIDENNPDLHMMIAIYSRDNKKYPDERKFLNIVIGLLEGRDRNVEIPEYGKKPFISKKYLKMKVEAYNMLGENQRIQSETILAENSYQKSAQVYYALKERKIAQPEKRFGRIFYNLGNLYYEEVNNLKVADIQYKEAVDSGFWESDMGYKIAYIDYTGDRFKDSLMQFYLTDRESPERPAVLYSIGNALYQRQDLNAAKGFYTHLIGLLEERRGFFRTDFPQKIEHLDLIYGLVLAYNNYGVVSYDLYQRTGDKSYIDDAYLNFVRANEFKDRISRNEVTLERPKWYSNILDKSFPVLLANNIPLINISKMNNPGVSKDLVFFTKIPKNWDVFPFISSDLKTMADYVPVNDEESVVSSIF